MQLGEGFRSALNFRVATPRRKVIKDNLMHQIMEEGRNGFPLASQLRPDSMQSQSGQYIHTCSVEVFITGVGTLSLTTLIYPLIRPSVLDRQWSPKRPSRSYGFVRSSYSFVLTLPLACASRGSVPCALHSACDLGSSRSDQNT